MLQRASTSGDLSIPRSLSPAPSDPSCPETIIRHSSEPSLSSQTNRDSNGNTRSAAKDVLSWIEDAGFSYEDFIDSAQISEHKSSYSTTIVDQGSYFGNQGETTLDLSSRPDSSFSYESDESADDPDEKRNENYNAILSEYFALTEELTADLEAIETLRRAPVPAQPDTEEEEEETALTTSRYRRFLVLEVSHGFDGEETKVRALDEANGMEHFLCLKDEWSRLDIRIGDYVNVVGRVEPKGSSYTYVVDHQRNLLILHPDILVSGTMLAHTSDCPRRSILNHCIKYHPRPDLPPPVVPNSSTPNLATPSTATIGPSIIDPTQESTEHEARPLKSHTIDPRLALYGIFVHEMFQSAILSMDFTSDNLTQLAEKIIVDHIVDVFSSGEDENKARETLHAWMPAVAEWADKFFPQARTDARDAIAKDPGSRFKSTTSMEGDIVEFGAHKYVLKVVQPIEVEEHVTSIMYGLKGDIDVSLLIKLSPLAAPSTNPREAQNARQLLPNNRDPSSVSTSSSTGPPSRNRDALASQSPSLNSLLLPLEIKSGALTSSFASQVILYSLLMADRYNRDVPTAILFSIKERNTVALEITRRQVSFAILNRNRIACFVHRPKLLPPVLKRANPCTSCYQVDSCMILHKAFEHGTPSEAGIPERLFNNITMNVTSPKHAAFLSHWFTLIDVESSEILRCRNQIWSVPQAERERQGRCLGGMRLVSMSSKRSERLESSSPLSPPPVPPPQPSSASAYLAPQKASSSPGDSPSQPVESQLPPSYSSSASSINKKKVEVEKSVLSGKRQLFLTFERWPISIAGAPNSRLSSQVLSPSHEASSHGFSRFHSTKKNRLDANTSTSAGLDLFEGAGEVDRTQTDCTPTSRRMPMLDLQFSPGDHVVLSEGRHTGIANCSVVEITPHSITLVCNRSELRAPPLDTSATILPTSQRFTPVQSKIQRRLLLSQGSKQAITATTAATHAAEVPDIESLPTGVTCMPSSSAPSASQQQHQLHASPFHGYNGPDFQFRKLSPIRWRLDRDEVQAGFNSLKGNVIQLFQATAWARKFRPLIVDLAPPKFEDVTLTEEEEKFVRGEAPLTNESTVPNSSISREGGFSMNADQRRVLHKVMGAQDYALVLGMPGTGKTSTIAAIVSVLIHRGKTVLISAGTHTAVDGLLIQCQRYGLQFLRLGQPEMVHPELRSQTLVFESQHVKSISDLNKLCGPGSQRYNLVGATCMGTNHPALINRLFDYCIIDEASQITLPVILGPMRLAKTCILVGDLYQLPPVVKNAKASGLSQSLFSRLSEAHPPALSKLRIQYRMNSDIMSLSNTLIYQHQLTCGSETVANRLLQIPHFDRLLRPSSPSLDDWMRRLLEPSRSVCFLNTDFVPATEEKLELKEVVRNPTEALLVAQITASLLKAGVHRHQIGIISPLRAQLKQIHASLASLHISSSSSSSQSNIKKHEASSTIDVHTVDKYQGSDVDCVIISLVRSNSTRNVGTLLKDWRRINVAFTRAKRKLIIIGSRTTLSYNHLLSAFFSIIDEKGWHIPLPKDAHRHYPF